MVTGEGSWEMKEEKYHPDLKAGQEGRDRELCCF